LKILILVIEGVLYKKIKLYDLDERKLIEKNVYFNSINTINFTMKVILYQGYQLFNLDNDERGNNTGTMIRELLKFTLNQNDDDIFSHKRVPKSKK
jgi:hypothetical protein